MTELLVVEDLVKHFPVKVHRGLRATTVTVQAVSGVSFTIGEGETLGLVGESGSGKSTVGRCILRLIEPTSGSIRFKGREITTMGRSELRALRPEMQIVFQDPFASLDPRMTVGSAIGEPLDVNGYNGDRRARVAELLELVGLSPDHAKRFPHEFSGGQRQRIGIARALSLDPSFLVLDEPVSALDVSVQAGVVNLLMDLQKEMGIAYLFIAHDLSVVRYISDRIAVLYLGMLMEVANRDELFDRPVHPYSHSLLSAVPVPDPELERKRRRIVLEGDLPSPVDPPSGCRFRTRCPLAQEDCATIVPPLAQVRPGHWAACHHPVLEGSLVDAVSGHA